MLVFLLDWFPRMFFTIWFSQMSVVLYHLSGLLEWQSVQAVCTVLVYYCMDLCVTVWLCCHFRHCVRVCVCCHIVILLSRLCMLGQFSWPVQTCVELRYWPVCVCCHIVILLGCLCMLCQFSWPVHTSVVVLWSYWPVCVCVCVRMHVIIMYFFTLSLHDSVQCTWHVFHL